MEYSIQGLARLAGVSTRTLRYYDQIGLLKPARVNSNGYRIYGQHEVDALQQVLFYRALGFELQAIADIVGDASFNRLEALRQQLRQLEDKELQLALLIRTVQKTIQQEEGAHTMTDTEKFAGLKTRLIEENEASYGDETRAKYGDAVVDESNTKFSGLSKQDYDAMQATGAALNQALAQAVRNGVTPDSEEAGQLVTQHKEWLRYTWPQYSSQAHKGLGDMYVADERFTAYYDAEQSGCAKLLRDAIHHWA